MRIISGTLRRRVLRAPKGLLTRPTSDRVKEALFNLVEARLSLDAAGVLDLFAGTGALGLEAISRGAASCTFVEESAQVFAFAKDNARALGVEAACVFVRSDAIHYLKAYHGPAYDLIMADPPYEHGALDRLPDLALPLLNPGGLFSLEHDSRHRFDDHPRLSVSRAYGRTVVSLFQAPYGDDAAPAE